MPANPTRDESESPHNLAEAYPLEQARIRRLLVFCKEQAAKDPKANRGLAFYAAMILEPLLEVADKAAADGDVVGMIRAYAAMQEIKE